MTKRLSLPMWGLLGLLLGACGLLGGGAERVITGSGQVTSETRDVAGIERVTLAGMGEVVIQEGASETLTIEAEDNILPLITSEVTDGTLRLDFDRATWRDTIRLTEPVRYVLTVRELDGLELSGSGSMSSSSLHADHLIIQLTGEGDVTVENMESGALDVRLEGAGNVNVAGLVVDQVVAIEGTGQYQAGELDSETARVTIGGSGDAVVWARRDLSVNITGSGTVSYWGDPVVSRRDISGAGDINPMGVK